MCSALAGEHFAIWLHRSGWTKYLVRARSRVHNVKKNTVAIPVLLLSSLLTAQSIDLGGESSTKSAHAQPSGNMGWGSSIEVGRDARAAEEALKRYDPAAAEQAAERATHAAPQNAHLWFLLGYAARLAGQLPTSQQAYVHGLKLDPNNLDGLSGLAQTYQGMGRVEDAKRTYMRLLALAPRREKDLLMAGEVFLRAGDQQQGIALLLRAEAVRPSAQAEVMLAIAYDKAGQPERAREVLAQAKTHDPNNPAVYRAVGNFYREQRDYAGAIAALKSSPMQSGEVLADLGYTYQLAGDQRHAAESYAAAAEKEPKQIGMQLSAAEAELRLGEHERTRSFLERAARIDAKHYRLHALQAQLAHAEKRNADAIREYEQAIANMPAGALPEGEIYPIELRLNLAEIERESGDEAAAAKQVADAERLVEQLRIEGAERAEFLRVRASIRVAAENWKDAEDDLREALRIAPGNIAVSLQLGDLLRRTKRYDEAAAVYKKVLEGDAKNRFALEALGGIARAKGDDAGAERWFQQYAADYPDDYVPRLALGDLFTSSRDFAHANDAYEEAFRRAPQNSLVVANAANAAIEAGQFNLAADWVGRATGAMLDDPRVMRERERVLLHQGKYAESARLGYQVLSAMPNDRDASVYLAYDLYNLGRYDESLALSTRYGQLLPREPNFPLLAGHVHKQSQLLQQALEDYSAALARDPRLVEGYVNRGYVLNDLQNANAAINDFHAALTLQPNNGVAHLGLAFSKLELHDGHAALDESNAAEKILGDSGALHLVRATAYRDLHLLDKAEAEYEAALRSSPDDLKLQLALADTEIHAHRYGPAIQTLNTALALSPGDPEIYAQLAQATAELHRRDAALHYVAEAEKQSPSSADTLMATGAALLTLGDQNGAMQRFSRALQAPDANRVQTRLLFARAFVAQRKFDAATQQVALAFAESRVGEASPVSADDFIEAANLFLAMSDFDLAQRYFERARKAGASDEVVAIGLANSAIAEGRTSDAQARLQSLGAPAEWATNFDYTMAQANIYRQQHQSFSAMTAFARAAQLGGEDDTASLAMQQEAAQRGVQVDGRWSANSDVLVHAIIDDATILGLDQQIFQNPLTGAIPPPRSSLETLWTNGFLGDLGKYPAVSGFFQVRNARGETSLPNEELILNRDTWDYNMNAALNPVLRLGTATFVFNSGLQFTIRRDKLDPFDINQNLFRQFAYVTSSPLGNWLTVQGEAFHESGPFTEQDLHSRELGARLQFTVGRPWGRTQLITAYGARDLLFRPLVREFYSTAASVGVQHEFSSRLRVAVLGEYIRSWRVQELSYWIAQAMRPAGQVEWNFDKRWSANADFSYSRGEGFHDYDNVQSSVFISYVRPLRRNVSDNYGSVPVEYPIRFSFGFQNASYFRYVGGSETILRPLIRLTLF